MRSFDNLAPCKPLSEATRQRNMALFKKLLEAADNGATFELLCCRVIFRQDVSVQSRVGVCRGAYNGKSWW